MKLEAVELIRLDVPLKSAFRTSEGSVTVHEVVWVHAITDVGEGWAECAANALLITRASITRLLPEYCAISLSLKP